MSALFGNHQSQMKVDKNLLRNFALPFSTASMSAELFLSSTAFTLTAFSISIREIFSNPVNEIMKTNCKCSKEWKNPGSILYSNFVLLVLPEILILDILA